MKYYTCTYHFYVQEGDKFQWIIAITIILLNQNVCNFLMIRHLLIHDNSSIHLPRCSAPPCVSFAMDCVEFKVYVVTQEFIGTFSFIMKLFLNDISDILNLILTPMLNWLTISWIILFICISVIWFTSTFCTPWLSNLIWNQCSDLICSFETTYVTLRFWYVQVDKYKILCKKQRRSITKAWHVTVEVNCVVWRGYLNTTVVLLNS